MRRSSSIPNQGVAVVISLLPHYDDDEEEEEEEEEEKENNGHFSVCQRQFVTDWVCYLNDMDNTYRSSSNGQQPAVHDGGCQETPYTSNRPPTAAREPTQPHHPDPRWAPSHGYNGTPCGLSSHFPAPPLGMGSFGGPFPPYGFDPSVPPPPFGCPPPGHFPNMVPSAPVNEYSSAGSVTFQIFPPPFRSGHQTVKHDADAGQRQQQRGRGDFPESGAPFSCTPLPVRSNDRDRSNVTGATRAEDERAMQKKQDQQWVTHFLHIRGEARKIPQTEQPPQRSGVSDLKGALYAAAQLLSQLAESCGILRNNVDNDGVWMESYSLALNVRSKLQDSLTVLSDIWRSEDWTARLSKVAKRRARRLRARTLQRAEESQREERFSDREAAIDTWRLQQIRRVEEKKKEQELKLAADAVLCVVRKKQADVKRMQEVLRSLEKLHRLRKEAALRKGIVTEGESEEVFSSQLEQLRCVLKKRTAVYSAEEKALMVMLEGEQEEERRREQEKRVTREREKQLQRKLRVEAMLFGDELPADSVLQPFREYYTQAECSLHTLLQIRREWDLFVVPADHPDGSPVPHSWILPDSPSDQAWASALQTSDHERDTL